MKSLITLSLALFAFGNVNAETSLIKGVVSNERVVAAVQAQQYENHLAESLVSEPGKFAPVADTAVLNPESVVAAANKALEDVIAEDKRITESVLKDEGYLFFQQMTAEDIISSDQQIIESTGVNDVRPLYLEKTIEDMIQEDNSIIEAIMPDTWTNTCPMPEF